MIYDFPNKDIPIRQGDIFYPLPLMIIDLDEIAVHIEGVLKEGMWDSIKDEENIVVHAPIKRTWGIVATQDCDASRLPVISFFEISEFKEVTRYELPGSAKKWMNMITQKSRLNARWFYLPEYEKIGFKYRMAINFGVTFQISRDNLEHNLQKLRRGRLNEIAYQHYRESIAQYFRRYPYDEWYPLSKDEFGEYCKNKDNVEPFEWQK
ncbi:MAG: hypothetical protein ACOZF2_10500 [Thermodesulfobacteriota bacterium]